MGKEENAEYYDKIFQDSEEYEKEGAQIGHAAVFQEVASLINRVIIGNRLPDKYGERTLDMVKIIDLGCGPGHLAECLHEAGLRHYHGFDFSQVAIDKCNALDLPPTFKFECRDLKPELPYTGGSDEEALKYFAEEVNDSSFLEQKPSWLPAFVEASSEGERQLLIFVSCEFLEHVPWDLELLKTLPEKATFIGSVPNQDAGGHVRWYPTMAHVAARYQQAMKLWHVDIPLAAPDHYVFAGLLYHWITQDMGWEYPLNTPETAPSGRKPESPPVSVSANKNKKRPKKKKRGRKR